MTERGSRLVRRTADRFEIGPSSVAWEARELVIRVCEWAVPLPRRMVGEIRVRPLVQPGLELVLDAGGGHIWQPVAPVARVSVRLDSPRLSWEGTAYLDHNRGAEPLEAGFSRWTWSRAHRRDGGCTVLYDATPRRGQRRRFALAISPDGTVRDLPAPPPVQLPGTIWRVPRETGCDAGAQPELVATFEDTPFYNRSHVRTVIQGEALDGFHESLDLDRFASPWVRMLLPFRMPRTT